MSRNILLTALGDKTTDETNGRGSSCGPNSGANLFRCLFILSPLSDTRRTYKTQIHYKKKLSKEASTGYRGMSYKSAQSRKILSSPGIEAHVQLDTTISIAMSGYL